MPKSLARLVVAVTIWMGLSSPSLARSLTLVDEARAAINLYSASSQVDPARADAKLFGLHLERHGCQTKAAMLDASASVLKTTSYACETQDQTSFCQPLQLDTGLPYSREGALYSGSFLVDALIAITDSLEKRGIDADSVSLFKVWQAEGGLQARIGFDASLIEVAFECDPRSQVFCRLAETNLRNEP